ncbi:unnamed protein product [Ectocarpus sp. 12 AP-2014]
MKYFPLSVLATFLVVQQLLSLERATLLPTKPDAAAPGIQQQQQQQQQQSRGGPKRRVTDGQLSVLTETITTGVLPAYHHDKDDDLREDQGGEINGHAPAGPLTSGSTVEDRIPSPSASARVAAAAGGGGGGYRDSAAATLVRGDTATGGGGGGGWRDEYLVAAAPAVAAAAVPGRRKASVVLGVPTVPRPKGVNYLEQTLQAVLAQVDQQESSTNGTPEGGLAITILVMNVHGPSHEAFYKARDKYEGRRGVIFMSVGEALDADGAPIVVGKGEPLTPKAQARKKVLPLTKVQEQTRDLVYLLRAAAGLADHYLFMEDDMLLCPGGAAAIGRMISKAHSYHPDWIAIRASFGMNGILIQDKDVLTFASYLEMHQKRRPPDHLVVEWFAGETPASAEFKGNRQHMAFRYNVFQHLGSVSTLRGKISPDYPKCFEELTIQTLFEVEAFDFKGCPDEDMSPCDVPASAKSGFPKIMWRDLYAEEGRRRRA